MFQALPTTENRAGPPYSPANRDRLRSADFFLPEAVSGDRTSLAWTSEWRTDRPQQIGGGETMNARQNYLLGLLMITASTVAWSLTGYFTRLVQLDSITIITWRCLFGAICLTLTIMALRGRSWRREFHINAWAEIFYIANSILNTTLVFTAYAYTSVAHVSVIFATIPFIAALMGWLLLREAPGFQAMAISFIALAGVWIMVSAGTDGAFFGDMLALAMTASSAFTIIHIRRHPDLPALGCAVIAMVLTAVICWPFADHAGISTLRIVQLAAFGIVNSAVGVALFALAARKLAAVEVALISATDMPMAVFWVWLAFDEQPGWNTFIGGGLVLGVVFYHVLAEAGRKRAVPA